jgi:tetratricopeptide (TPR) repeat protein
MKAFSTLLLFLVLAPLTGMAQQSTTSNPKESEEYKRQMMVYNLSKRYNDFTATRTALLNMIAIDPQDKSLLDSLALIYFDFEQYGATAIVTNDALALEPNNLLAMELNAIAYENLGFSEEAITRFQSLYIRQPSLDLLYKIAFLQYESENYNQCRVTIKQLMEDATIDTEKVAYASTMEGERVEVTMRTAIKFLLGLVEKAEGNTDEAKRLFEEILYEHPNFALVKENLASLDN